MKTNPGGKNMQMIFTLLLFVLFVALVFIVLLYSAGFYKRIGESTEQLNGKSSAMLFITQKIHSSDYSGGISADKKMLRLDEVIDGEEYSTYIYCDNGYLCELFTEKDKTPDLSYGNIITPLDRLDIEYINDCALEIKLAFGAEIFSRKIYINCGISYESQVA